jgi:hypothetical protein
VHREALERLRAGEPHPAREQVLEWGRLATVSDETWQALTSAERDTVLPIDRDHRTELPAGLPAGVQRYLDADAKLVAVYRELCAGEFSKIELALRNLDDWLSGVPQAADRP